MKKLILAALAGAFLTAGCATNDTVSANESVADREYPTGSNIPRKKGEGGPSGVTTIDREAIERSPGMSVPSQPKPRGG